MELINFLAANIAKVGTAASTFIGYVATAAGAITLMDKALVARTLGPAAMDWALLLAGVLGVFTGHALVRSQKLVRAFEAERAAARDAQVPFPTVPRE